jgi:hypothetical protein
MQIFPLSIAAKIVLILIAIMLGIICFALWSERFRNWIFRRKSEDKLNGGKRE